MLDRSRSYAQVFGKPGVTFAQDNIEYDSAGVAVAQEVVVPVVAPVEPVMPEPVESDTPRKRLRIRNK